ncbi:hypothetical protein [Chloroflexus sp.]|uniref:hypothetical protein n=1 Tax=Chloroflexus sp. TaxID=1904827 RepID=UPI00262F7E6F|nr:hypothetical protein [uncultured Chloroflexus sp.]
MDEISATELARQIEQHRQTIAERVAGRLLRAFPELAHTLRLEEQYGPVERMAEVSVRPLSDLIRAMLLFNALEIAETELRWARGVLPRWGVSYEHTTTMIRWYFEEVGRLPLSPAARAVAAEVEQHLLSLMIRLYRSTESHQRTVAV